MESGVRTNSDRVSAIFLEAVAEVTQTVLTNQSFFPARNLLEVKAWVARLFPETSEQLFEEAFARSVLNPELPWGKRRFFVIQNGIEADLHPR